MILWTLHSVPHPLVFARVSPRSVIFVVPSGLGGWDQGGPCERSAAPPGRLYTFVFACRSHSCHRSRCRLDLPARPCGALRPPRLSTARTHSPGSGGQTLQNMRLSVRPRLILQNTCTILCRVCCQGGGEVVVTCLCVASEPAFIF